MIGKPAAVARLRSALLAVALLAAQAPVAQASVGQAPVAQASVTPGAPQQAKPPVFEDTFVDNRAGWPSDAPFYLATDGYHLDAREVTTGTARTVQPGASPRLADMTVEAEMTRLEGPAWAGYGVTLRSTVVPRRVYRAIINGYGLFTIDRITEVGVRDLVSWRQLASINRRAGQANRLRFVAKGKVLSLYVNGQLAAWIEDDAIPEAGAMGLFVSGGAHVVARRLSVMETADADVVKPAVPVSPIIFDDRFFDNREAWGPENYLRFAEDGLHLVPPYLDGDSHYSVDPSAVPWLADLSVEAEIRKLDGSDYDPFGVALRATTDLDDHYSFWISGEGSFTLYRHMGDEWTPLVPWRRHAAIHVDGSSNLLRLSAKGDRLAAFVNGQRVALVQDAGISGPGNTMLQVSDTLHVVVRSFIVTEPRDADFVAIVPPAGTVVPTVFPAATATLPALPTPPAVSPAATALPAAPPTVTTAPPVPTATLPPMPTARPGTVPTRAASPILLEDGRAVNGASNDPAAAARANSRWSSWPAEPG